MKIGFVPTMGALHEGHCSLIKKANDECDLSVCSIFVNPTQFNNQSDLEKYPRTIEHDMELLIENDCDVLFLPDVNEMYPEGKPQLKNYELGFLDTVLEAKFRPGHFQGVANVVYRLLKKTEPDVLFLGKKDFQQVMVIKRMMELEKLNCKVEAGETLREPSGLAMSSRNIRLSTEDRNNASQIFKTLTFLKENISSNNSFASLKEQAIKQLKNIPGSELEYIEICNSETLQPIQTKDETKNMIALVAIWIGGVRLIDNLELN